MNYSELNRFKTRGLFVFSDPAGAKAILAFIKLLEKPMSEALIISDRNYSFFDEFQLQVNKPNRDLLKDIDSFNPDYVFCGTSYTSKIELEYIQLAKQLNIPTHSFIDHWTSLRERFHYNGKDVFPDTIFVINENAKRIGIQKGIPEEKIKIFGNPYWNYLHAWKPSLTKEMFFKTLNLDINNKFIVVYAPEPLSNVNGKERFGFDEMERTAELNSFVASREFDNMLILLKPHHNQDIAKLKSIISNDIVLLDKETDANTLIFYADLVLGYFSNFLIEAVKMGKKVVRLMNPDEADPLSGLGIGEKMTISELEKVFKIMIN